MAHAMRLPSGRAAPTSGHGYADRTHAGIRSPSAKATASIAAITAKDAPSKLHSLTSHGRTHSGGGALEAAAETPTHAHASAKSNAKSNAHANANDSASGGGSQSHSGQSSGQSSASGSAKGSLRDRRGSVGALQVGSRVVVAEGAFKGKVGVIAYAGPVKFAAGSGGTWVGVCLDTADGKHDGSVQGERYFQCEPLHGIFVKKSMLRQEDTVAMSELEIPLSARVRAALQRSHLLRKRASGSGAAGAAASLIDDHADGGGGAGDDADAAMMATASEEATEDPGAPPRTEASAGANGDGGSDVMSQSGSMVSSHSLAGTSTHSCSVQSLSEEGVQAQTTAVHVGSPVPLSGSNKSLIPLLKPTADLIASASGEEFLANPVVFESILPDHPADDADAYADNVNVNGNDAAEAHSNRTALSASVDDREDISRARARHDHRADTAAGKAALRRRSKSTGAPGTILRSFSPSTHRRPYSKAAAMAEHKATLVRGRKDSNVGATPRVLSPVPHITIPTPRAQPPGPIELPAHAAHPPDGIAVAARPPGMAVGVGRAGDAAEFSRPHRRESDPLLRIPELSHGSQDAQDPSQFPHPPTAVSDSRSPSDAVPPRGDASTASVHFAGLPPKTARGAVPFVSSVFDFGPKSARLSSLGSLGSAVAPRSTAAARMETRALLKERYGSAAAVAAGKGLRHSASVDDPASNPVAAFEKMVFDVRMKQWKQRALLDRDENFDMDLARLNERNNDMNVDAEFVQKALADEKKGTWDIRNIEFDNHSDSEFEAEGGNEIDELLESLERQAEMPKIKEVEKVMHAGLTSEPDSPSLSSLPDEREAAPTPAPLTVSSGAAAFRERQREREKERERDLERVHSGNKGAASAHPLTRGRSMTAVANDRAGAAGSAGSASAQTGPISLTFAQSLPDNIGLVVCDLIGTLVDDRITCGSESQPISCVAFASALKSSGIHIFPEDVLKHRGKHVSDALNGLLREHGPTIKNENEAKAFADDIHSHYVKALGRLLPQVTREMEGATATLLWLKHRSIRVAVTCDSPHFVIDYLLESFQWRDLVDYVTSFDKLGHGKPDPVMILDSMRNLDVFDPRHVVRVGDTRFDILEGKNANVWTVGVASGPGAMARKNMVKSGPDFVIDNVSELRTLWTTKLPPSAPVAGRSQRRGSMASPPAAAAASASAAALAGRSAMSPPPTAPAPSRQRRGSELRTGTPADTAANGSATIAASLLPPPAVEVAAAAPSADRADVRVGAIAEGNST